MKKNKNRIKKFLGITTVLAVTFSYQYLKKIQHNEFREMAKINNAKVIKSKNQKSLKTAPSRNIASVATSSIITKFKNRQVVGLLGKEKKNFIINNKINKDWKKLALNRLNKMVGQNIKLEIQNVKPVLFIKHNMGKYAEHVKIILKKESGLKSAYDAYVDSQTGAIIRTWNRTKFEIKPKFLLKSHGNEFVSIPIKTKKSTSI